jgi:peptide/nickel transport system ATP-binding protein
MYGNQTILNVDNLQVSFFQKRKESNILHELSLELRRGELLTILGESGSGKSTIAKAITGLLPPSAILSGQITIGQELPIDLSDKRYDWRQVRGKKLATIFQDAKQSLNPVMKIRHQFEEMLFCHQLIKGIDVKKYMVDILEKLNFMNPYQVLESYPFQLSGGMCQRICIAMAVCLKPMVLIADEPTSALDTVSQREVLALLKKVGKDYNQSILFITHDIAVASAVSDRIIVLNNGEIAESGDPEKIFSNPQTAYTKGLMKARNILCFQENISYTACKTSILNINNLEKKYLPGKPILKNVNLSIYPNEIVGILGQSGCGKSTLARCIMGLEAPQKGEIHFKDIDITRLKGSKRRVLCKYMQMIFQDARASINPRYTATQIVLEPLKYLKIGSVQQQLAQAHSYLNEVGITGDMQNRRPPQLSTGQCQRIAIARALIVKPDLLLCDEAVSALDMSLQSQMLELLQHLQKQFGFSILMISHDIRILRSFCHRIAVMKDGEFCEICGSGSELKNSKEPYTQLLLSCERELEDDYCAKIAGCLQVASLEC